MNIKAYGWTNREMEGRKGTDYSTILLLSLVHLIVRDGFWSVVGGIKSRINKLPEMIRFN